MNNQKRLEKTFSKLKENNKKALIPFITLGDPKGTKPAQIMHSLVEGGADIIELGLPFSDPAADGKAIADASQRAIDNGMNYNVFFKVVEEFRQKDQETPVVLMGYLNPCEVYPNGFAGFCQQAKKSGVDAMILVDLSFESSEEYRVILNDNNIDLINLLTPTTSASRIKQIVENATGFIYYVSMRGITGSDAKLDTKEISQFVENIKNLTNTPVCIGFGIKNKEMVDIMGEIADGVVVGSALVSTLFETAKANQDVCKTAENFIKQLKN